MQDDDDIKWEVISRREGDCWLSPYVPLRSRRQNYIGNEPVTDALAAMVALNSGVTVATGFDLGTKSSEQLGIMGIPEEICDKVDRFCGLRKRKAMEELHNAIHETDDPYAIDLTETEAEMLDLLNKQYMSGRIRHEYDKGIKGRAHRPGRPVRKKFAELDPSVKTAIVCFAFQYGENLTAYARLGEPRVTFAKLIFDQEWLAAASFLRDLDNDKLRRQIEAAQFEEFCRRDSERSSPTTPEGSALKSLRRHDEAAKNWKGPGRPPEW